MGFKDEQREDFNRICPVVVGEQLRDIEVTGKGEKGDLIVRVEKFIVFLKNTNGGFNVGDRVNCVITFVKPTCAFAELI